jgi:hypothetical protein
MMKRGRVEGEKRRTPSLTLGSLRGSAKRMGGKRVCWMNEVKSVCWKQTGRKIDCRMQTTCGGSRRDGG